MTQRQYLLYGLLLFLPVVQSAEEPAEFNDKASVEQAFQSLRDDVNLLFSEAKQLLSEANTLKNEIKQEQDKPTNNKAVIFLLWTQFEEINEKASKYVKNPGQTEYNFPELIKKADNIVALLKTLDDKDGKLLDAENKLSQWRSIESVDGNKKS